jgi:hypothetical protein
MRCGNTIAPLIPVHVNTHRFGGGRPRVPDRVVMDGIFDVARLEAELAAERVRGDQLEADNRRLEWSWSVGTRRSSGCRSGSRR